ncbi:MAG: gliding motility-associated C-terminal domain-containing protein [Bacteroidia bacterium]|nr:gliding motility-associated C-terminal domain-containing protein [Bacteroidia bacterium]
MKNIHKVVILVCFGLISMTSLAQKPTASFSYNGSCDNKATVFTNTSLPGGGTITRYSWSFGTGNIEDTSDVENPQFTYTTNGSYWVSLIVQNSNGDLDTSFQNVFIYPTPEIGMDVQVPCIPSPIIMTDNSLISIGSIASRVWDIDGNISTAKTYSHAPMSPGKYSITLTVNSDNYCSNSMSKEISYTEKPILTFTPVGPIYICENDTISVSVNGADNFNWSNGSTTNFTDLYNTGYHVVTGYTGNNCFTSDSIYLEVVPNPIANAGSDKTIINGGSTTLDGSGGDTYLWSPSTGLSDPTAANPIATPLETTKYVVTVGNANGCISKDSLTVFVIATSAVPVHNMITPNNDGFNDVWDLSSINGIETAEVHVFNRWGWEVFKSDDYDHDWQGDYQNKPLVDGTYLYVIKFKDTEREALRGTLEIIRNTQK